MGSNTQEIVSEEAILTALRAVEEPSLNQDLVTSGRIKDLHVAEGDVRFTLSMFAPGIGYQESLRAAAREAVEALDGVTKVEVDVRVDVPDDGRARGMVEAPIRNVIAVASGKGGVGKSTVAVNIAVSLAQAGAAVGLLDADIYGPNIPTMMGVEQMPTPREDKLVPAQSYGVRMISIAFMVKPGQPLVWRGPMLHSAIRQFITDVEWGELDYLIVDLPPGTGDAQLSLTQTIPLSGGVIVTLPQQVSLDDARRGLEMFRSMDVPIFGVVENMSYLELPDGTQMDVFGAGGGQHLAAMTGVPYLGSIPLDPAIRQGGDSGVPIVVAHPHSASAQSLMEVAQDVAIKAGVAALQNRETISIQMLD